MTFIFSFYRENLLRRARSRFVTVWYYWFSCGAESVAYHTQSFDSEFYLFFLFKILLMVVFIRILGATGSVVPWFVRRLRSSARNASMLFCVWTLNRASIYNLLQLLL